MKKLYVAFIVCVFVLTITPQTQSNYKPRYFCTLVSLADAFLAQSVVTPTPTPTPTATPTPTPTPATLLSGVSRRTHGGAGTFDVALPLAGTPGIECRGSSSFQVIATFTAPVTVNSASVTMGTGSVSSFSVSGSQVTVNLTGVPNAQTIAITLSTDQGCFSIPMSVLTADTNANGAVNAADVSQTKFRTGQTVDATNFRSDQNGNGTINAADVAIVKSLSGTALPLYVGVDPVAPDISTQTTDPSGTSINLTEGNLIESQAIGGTNCPTCAKCSDGQATLINTHCISFTLTYNSRDAGGPCPAAGSRPALYTALGSGWTHSFNMFLFSQGGDDIFRFDDIGRVTKYTHNPDDTYTADPGRFETLVRQSSSTFVLTQKDHTQFTFVGGPIYRLMQIRDRNNDTMTLTYSGGNLMNVTDTYGRSMSFSYDGNQHVASVTDPLGRTTTFTYDSTGSQLITVTDPEGQMISYSYDSRNQLTSKLDKDGRLYSYTYTNNQPTASNSSDGSNFTLNYMPSFTIKADGRGNQWRYDYDSNAYLTRMTAPDGAITTYTYDAATRRLQSVTDANTHTTQYQYDSQGHRTRITLPAPFNYVTMFTYEPMFNMMTTMTDPKGRVTTYSYDSQGNRTMETDPLLQTRQWTYDAHGNVLTETDKRGNTTTYTYDAAGNRNSITAPAPLGYVTTMTYDGVGNLKTRADPNNHTTMYDYDGLNRLIKQTDPSGHFDQYVYDNQGNRIQEIDRNNHSTFFQYDQRGRLIKMTDALSHFETYGYDANNNRASTTDRNGHTTTYQYDVQNRLSMTTDAVGNVTSMAYDPVGNMTSMTDANLHTTSYTYDALNRRSTVTNSLGYVTMFEYDMGGSSGCGTCGATPGTSIITMQTDGNGKVTYFRYDELARQTKIIRKEGDVDPDPDPSDAVTSYTYDPNNNQITMMEPDNNTTMYHYDVLNRRDMETNAAGDITQFTYDGANNLITTTAPNGNVTTSNYDVVDRLTQVDDSVGRVVSYSYDFVGNRFTQTDGNNNTTSYSYDVINRLIATTDPLTQSMTTLYDPVGNVLKVTDREGKMTMHGYDNINRRISTTDALSHITQYQYDGVGNLMMITDANGHATQYTYDNINRRTVEIYADPPPNTRAFTYDAVNMISRTDQRGQTTNYIYNDLYFLLHRTYPVSPADNMTYDLSGRMLTAQRGGWVVTFAYDGGNRVTQTQQNAKTIGYVYNIPGRTRIVTYPGGRQLTEATDARTRLDHIDDGTSPPIVQYSYDLGNRVGTRNYRNGTVATYTYNANDWTTSLEHMFGATRIAGFGYDFDHEGNKKFEEKRHDPTHSESYQYDDVYRLVNYKVAPLPSPTPIITQTAYNLDAVGNWNSKTTDGVTQTRMHNAANELTMIDATNLLYDDNGNLQNDGTYTYAYDEQNRLTQVTRNSDNEVVGQYQYDALSRRVKKIANPAGTPIETRYFYDDARIIEEQSSIGTTLATYVYGNYIDEVLSMDRGAQAVFYHQSSLWSVEAITNATGAPIERYSYDAYGKPSVFDGSGGPVPPNPWGTPHSAIGNPYLFTGRQLNEETGLYFYRARYYDSVKGRFLQRDAGGYVDGMNLYEYVRGRPTFGVDPTGLACAEAAATCEVTKIDVSSDDGVAKPQQDETQFSLRWFIAIEGKDLKLCESAQFNTIVVSLWNEKGTALKKEEVLKAYESSKIQSEPQTHPFAENAKDQGDEFGFGKGEAWGQFKSDKTKVTLDRHLQYIPYYRDSEEEKKYYAYKNKGDFVLKVRDKKTKEIVKEHKWGYEYRNYKGDAPKAPVESEKDAGIYSHYGISGKVPFDKGG